MDHALRKLSRPGFLQHFEFCCYLGAKSLPYAVASALRMFVQWPPTLDRQRVFPLRPEVGPGEMQMRQCLANSRAVVRTWPPDPQSVEKRDDRGRPSGDLVKEATVLVLYRLRTGDATIRQMLHQAQEKRQIAFSDPLFV